MSSPDTPPTPDYRGAAEETAKGAEKGLTQQTYANRPTINTPWGSQTWGTSTAIDPSTGQPVTQWQQNVNLSPQQQQALDSQTAITTARSNAALDMLPQVTRGFGAGVGGSGYGLGFGAPSSARSGPWKDMAGPGGLHSGATVDYAVSPGASTQPAAPRGGDESSGYGNPYVSFFGPQPQGRAVSPTTSATPLFGGSTTAPMSFGGSPGGVTVDPNYWRAAGQGAALGFQQPLQQQRQQQLETQLSNMGLARGSEAWRNEMRGLQDQNARDNLQAFGAGQSESNQMFNQALQANNQGLQANNQAFGQGLAGAGFGLQQQNQAFGQNLSAQGFNQSLRQQQIAEMLQARSQPLNEMNALLSGQQIGMPQMPGASQVGRAQGVDYSGALQGTYGAQLQNANAENAASASRTNAMMNLGSMAFMFSDSRLKQDIEKVGELVNGIGVYKYRFVNSPEWELGVIAQDVLEIMPDAVKQDDSGYLMVNYSMVLSDE